jgi:hypothetical protein
MGKLNSLILKIVLGAFAATNFVACIITTDLKVLAPLNLLVAIVCLGIYLFIDSNISSLSRDLGISKKEAGKLVGEYFVYYKNVEKISIDEYLKRSSNG